MLAGKGSKKGILDSRPGVTMREIPKIIGIHGATSALNDTDVADDILWAVGAMNQSADIEITESKTDWPCMQSVLFGAERGK